LTVIVLPPPALAPAPLKVSVPARTTTPLEVVAATDVEIVVVPLPVL
jgi:hypothetical protein